MRENYFIYSIISHTDAAAMFSMFSERMLFSLLLLLPPNPGHYHANPSPSFKLLITSLPTQFSLQSILHIVVLEFYATEIIDFIC